MSAPRLAVVGVGANVWFMHRPAIEAADFELALVHDLQEERARLVAADLPGTEVASFAEILASDCDVVSIIAPHPVHAELAQAALRAGKHVLVEKPITRTVDEARQLIRLAADQRRLLGVCLQQRTRGEVVAARRLVSSGVLGELQYAQLIGRWPRRTAYFATAPWRATWAGEGGGISVNQGQHDLDLLCHLVGPPSRVLAIASNVVHRTQAEDTVSALVQWPSGSTGAIHLSSAEAGPPQSIELVGTGGRLRVLPGRLESWVNPVDFPAYARSAGDPYEAPESVRRPDIPGTPGGHHAIDRNLRAALRDGERLVAPADEAIHALELAAAARDSAQRGEFADLPLAAGRHTELLEQLEQLVATAS